MFFVTVLLDFFSFISKQLWRFSITIDLELELFPCGGLKISFNFVNTLLKGLAVFMAISMCRVKAR